MIELIVAVIVLLIAIGYYYVNRQYKYFENLKIPFVKPIFPYGSVKGFGTETHTSLLFQKMYNDFVGKTPFVGLYFFTRPVGFAIDPELIKSIMLRDFTSFSDRGMYYNEKADPLSSHLLSLDGPKWKRLRSKLSPTFTSGKMKLMFDIIAKSAETMSDVLKDAASKKEEVEFRDLFNRYGMDVIGSCAFGIECNSFDDAANEFRTQAKRIFEPSKLFVLRQIVSIIFPKLAQLFSLRVTDAEVSEFFMRIVRETLEYRTTNSVTRNDFFQLLMDLKKSEDADMVKDTELSLEEIAAQVFLFFAAGFETSSATLSFTLFELGRHPEIQQRVRDEIVTVLEKYEGKTTYESLSEMKYLSQVINESLRLYPPFDSTLRKAVKNYTIPDKNYKIEKGLMISIPIFAIQRDPQYYPDPLTFDPERFNDEQTAKRHPFTFLPFGEGPRNCIAMRFALMQVRLGLIEILRKYKISHSEKTPKEVDFVTNGQTLILKGGVWLKVEDV